MLLILVRIFFKFIKLGWEEDRYLNTHFMNEVSLSGKRVAIKNGTTWRKEIEPVSRFQHKVLLWKDWTRLSSILSLPHRLGQVQLSALPRIASWCDGPHKDEPIKRLTDILELNKLADGAVDRRSLIGLFFKELQVTSYWKNSPRYHPLIGERRNYTVCISYSPLIAYLVIKRAYT